MEERMQGISYGKEEAPPEKKGRKNIKKQFVLLFLFLFFSSSMLLFLRLPCFTVQEITINGLDKVSAEEILYITGLQGGMNIWRISVPKIRERASTISRIAEVHVEKILPGKIEISIVEKCSLAMIPFHGSYLELASDGYIIDICDQYLGELPLISGLSWGKMDVGTNITDRARGEIVEEFLEAMVACPALPLAEINVSDTEQIIVYTWEGMEAWLGNKNDLMEKLEVLQQLHQFFLLEENYLQKGYFDLRVAETPVFIPLSD
ncbi:MAG: cell division protein FtsQ/DivIB [Dethiobacteria bacterium]|jgi:cell division protein FtsQ